MNNKIKFIFIFLALISVFYLIFVSPFFPNQNGNLGHDYDIWFPRMLSGVYHYFENGLTEIPWFTPSCCGGTLLYANPQYLFFSIPQFLNFYFDPITTIKITILIFASLGFLGAFLLTKNVFNLSKSSSIFMASFFLFNGFFAYRMIIGHLGYHSYMLLPFIAYFLFQPNQQASFTKNLFLAFSSSLLFSYVLYSGSVHLLLPISISLVAILLLALIQDIEVNDQKSRIIITMIFILCITASKLNISFETLETFARDYYPLPGIDGITYSLWVPIKSIFFGPFTWMDTNNIFTNSKWTIQRHELELSITFIPLMIIILGGTLTISERANLSRRQKIYSLGLFLLCLLPLLINFYNPTWNAILKDIPIIRNSVMLVRWYIIYIPLFLLIAAIILNKLKYKKFIIPILIILMIYMKYDEDKNYYLEQSYDPEMAITAYNTFKESLMVPTISHITNQRELEFKDGKRLQGRDEMMGFGMSQINCNESLFGYLHEDFKKKGLLQINTAVTNLSNERYNMKNPACYVFPEENNCSPGDHFTFEQKEELMSFVSYKGFDFNMTKEQHIFNWLSLIAFTISSFYILIYILKVFIFKVLN